MGVKLEAWFLLRQNPLQLFPVTPDELRASRIWWWRRYTVDIPVWRDRTRRGGGCNGSQICPKPSQTNRTILTPEENPRWLELFPCAQWGAGPAPEPLLGRGHTLGLCQALYPKGFGRRTSGL